ncbi:hypothetical protein Goshw_002653, partial [Gossypium schwendimanii]|nr:hypothetical protein [Gossypium schwendimanii]
NGLANLSLEDGKEEVLLVQNESESNSQNVVALWTFNNHLLVFHRLKDEEDPMKVLLVLSTLWVQVYELPLGLFSKSIAKQLGDFIGKFLEYDSKSLNKGLRCMGIVKGNGIDMKHDLEESPTESGDGKKRPRKNIRNYSVLRVIDSPVVKEERSLERAYFLSVTAKG